MYMRMYLNIYTVCMCMHIYIYTLMKLYIFTDIYIYICLHTYNTYVRTHTQTHSLLEPSSKCYITII